MQLIKRSSGRSVVAAAAYRAGEKLFDERRGEAHDYSNRSGVEHTEILTPPNAPAWCLNREALWNKVEESEKRKDAQLARELRFAIPREIPADQRIGLARDYIQHAFVDRGMVADYALHNKIASDGREQPHVHVLLTLRRLEGNGFGRKSRHEWVPDPSGRLHDDGHPVLVMDNPQSWNSAVYFESTRERWERVANDALAGAGSMERIDRRSLLARGLSRLPEPALRMAWYMRDLYGCMKERFGQFQVARHYRAVEQAAKDGFRKLPPAGNPAASRQATAERFYDWFDRQITRLGGTPTHSHVGPEPSPNRDVGRDR